MIHLYPVKFYKVFSQGYIEFMKYLQSLFYYLQSNYVLCGVPEEET